MKQGFSTALRKRLRRGDPKAKVIVQSVVTTRAAKVSTKDEWEEADSLSGLTVQDDGSVILSGAQGTLLDRDLDDQVTGLPGAFPQAESCYVGVIQWDTSNADPFFILDTVEVELDPDTGGGQLVDQWVMQLFTVEEGGAVTDDDYLPRAIPVSKKVYANAGGAVARVAFDFTSQFPIRPASYPAPAAASGTRDRNALFTRPTTFFTVYGVDEAGVPVTNVGWRTTAGIGASYTEDGHKLQGFFTSPDPQGGLTVQQGPLPNIEVIYSTFSQATITFTNNPLDLGATPTGTVQFASLLQEPGGSSITLQVRNDADTAWVTFQDGDTTDDLAGVGKRQTYAFRATLNPGVGVSPILSEVMVRELVRVDLQDIATVRPRGSVAIDPITLKGEIMEYDILVVRDGRRDFQDQISQLLSENALRDLELEIYIGHPDLPRADWLLVDRALVDDHQDRQDEVTLTCLSVHRELAQDVPQVKGTTSLTSTPLVYPNTTLKAVWDDILANQIDLAGRFIGPGLEDTSITVNNVVEQGKARDLLDQVAYIAGGGVIASQGRIVFRSLYQSASAGVSAIWPKEEVSPQGITPGARYRTPRISIRYGYDFNAEEFKRQYQAEQENAVDSFGITALRKAEVPEDVGKWVTDSTTAATLCRRVVNSIGEGLILWALKTSVPYPELEPGDVVAVEVEEFLAKDPNAARFIKGPQLVLATITAVHDVMGTDFDVWIQSLSDILPTTTEVTRETVFGSGEDGGAMGLSNFRVLVQGSTYTRFGWDRGGLVNEVDVFNTLVSLPSTGDPWPSSTEAPTATIPSTDPQRYDVAFPDAQQARYLTFRPYTAGAIPGPVIRRVVEAPRPPVVDVDFSETDTVGTLWLSAKGLGISSVLFSRKSGRNSQSAFATATRVGSTGSTAVSVVKGGFLGPGEYEQDVTLANNLNSFIRSRLTLYNGDVQVYGPFTFDSGNLPNFLNVGSAGRKVLLTGDTDVKSLLLKRTMSTGVVWRKRVDGFGADINVGLLSTSGAAGMGSTEEWTMRAVAFNVPKGSASTASTNPSVAKVFQDLTVTGEDFVASTLVPTFAAPRPTAFGPESSGNGNLLLILRATQSSTDGTYSYRVYERHDDGGGFSTYSLATGNFTPQPLGISTLESTHVWNTGYLLSLGFIPQVTYDLKCQIISTAGAVLDEEVVSASWAYST